MSKTSVSSASEYMRQSLMYSPFMAPCISTPPHSNLCSMTFSKGILVPSLHSSDAYLSRSFCGVFGSSSSTASAQYSLDAALTIASCMASISSLVPAFTSGSLTCSLRLVTLDLTDSTPLDFSLASGTLRYFERSSATTSIIMVPW